MEDTPMVPRFFRLPQPLNCSHLRVVCTTDNFAVETRSFLLESNRIQLRLFMWTRSHGLWVVFPSSGDSVVSSIAIPMPRMEEVADKAAVTINEPIQWTRIISLNLVEKCGFILSVVSDRNCYRSIGRTMAEEKKKGRVILVAIDESEESMRALEWALVNASIGGMDDRLILIHAQRNPSSYAQPATPGYILTGDVLGILQRDVRKFTERVFARAVEICDAKKVTPETKVHVGDARDVLCDAVKRLKPDMLVLGSHGYGPLRRAVLGSVSDYCAHHAECPVVIVRPHKVKASRK